MSALREKLRQETGMRRLLDIAVKVEHIRQTGTNGHVDETGVLVMDSGARCAYRMRRRAGELPSMRPVLVLTENPEHAERLAGEALGRGHTVMTTSVGAPNATQASRAEAALALARLLAHRNAGKTVIVHAEGNQVPPAALMFVLERGYFATLTLVNPPPDCTTWPTWQEMAK